MVKRKIGILTQPLHDNYGGLLQAYALSQKLEELGHRPVIINRGFGYPGSLRKLMSELKQKILGSGRYVPTLSEKVVISEHTLAFRKKYFPNLTNEILTNVKMMELNGGGYDAYVVGSDQCWRPRYSPCLSNYFFDFARGQSHIKRIAYAASFGTSEWEFTPEQTQICRELIKKFDAVSVREDSAVNLCFKYLERKNVVHVLDPTMLWDRFFYDEVVGDEQIHSSGGNLKAYILDKTEEKSDLTKYLENKLDLKAFEVMPLKRLGKERPQNLLDYQYPSPLQWLKGYQEAKFVVTDSFHGIVFAILYNVPFLAIGNQQRGMARFSSLLKMFDLENRLIEEISTKKVDEILDNPIKWNKVNTILKAKRQESIDFLKQNLS